MGRAFDGRPSGTSDTAAPACHGGVIGAGGAVRDRLCSVSNYVVVAANRVKRSAAARSAETGSSTDVRVSLRFSPAGGNIIKKKNESSCARQ